MGNKKIIKAVLDVEVYDEVVKLLEKHGVSKKEIKTDYVYEEPIDTMYGLDNIYRLNTEDFMNVLEEVSGGEEYTDDQLNLIAQYTAEAMGDYSDGMETLRGMVEHVLDKYSDILEEA